MMKYEEPKIEIVMLDTDDVITASNGGYEIENDGNGNGNILFGASSIF